MSVTAAQGFTATGVACGVKESGDLDLALVATDDGVAVSAAGVFTRNKMAAAPVTVSRSNLRTAAGHASAVILNSGNANAATGEPGIQDAETMAALTAAELGADPHQVLVCSTGLIGNRLPMDRIEPAIPDLVSRRSPSGGVLAAEAILTTDTCAKEAVVERHGFIVGGMAKGAAMLAPDMATMLAVLTTDAVVEPEVLREMLVQAADVSFNVITIDGATSTNDTVLILASGRAGAVDPTELAAAVRDVSVDLAGQMCDDAEGATKVVRISVRGAVDDADAAIAARRVAESQLVKCSWYGKDAYWGRVASELGSAGVHFDQRLVSISYGDIVLCRAGVEVDFDQAELAAYMEGRHIKITADLGLGAGHASILTNDLTHGYVDENMGTS